MRIDRGRERLIGSPLQTTRGIDWSISQAPFAGITLGVRTALPQHSHHLRVFTEMETSNPIGATHLGNLKRHERSRATGQPSSQITLRPASLIEKYCFKEPPRFGTWSIEPLQNRDVIELSSLRRIWTGEARSGSSSGLGRLPDSASQEFLRQGVSTPVGPSPGTVVLRWAIQRGLSWQEMAAGL